MHVFIGSICRDLLIYVHWYLMIYHDIHYMIYGFTYLYVSIFTPYRCFDVSKSDRLQRQRLLQSLKLHPTKRSQSVKSWGRQKTVTSGCKEILDLMGFVCVFLFRNMFILCFSFEKYCSLIVDEQNPTPVGVTNIHLFTNFKYIPGGGFCPSTPVSKKRDPDP